MRGIRQKDFQPITCALSVQKKVSENTVLCIKHNFQSKLVCSIHSIALLSQDTVLQLTTDNQVICAQVHTQCHKSYVRVIRQVRVICTSKGMQKSLGCALYVRCALSVGKYVILKHEICTPRMCSEDLNAPTLFIGTRFVVKQL